MDSIAERLRLLRGKKSQSDFSADIGLLQTTYGRYERGQSAPDTDTVATICRTLGVNPRWLILGEEPMYDAEASQERPRLKAKDLVGREEKNLPADVQRSMKKTRKAMQAWGQEWERLPEWAKEEIDELYEQVEAITKERDEARAELLKAKDEAIQALKSRGSMIDTIPDVLLLAKALKAAGALESPEQFPEVNIEGLRKILDEQPKK